MTEIRTPMLIYLDSRDLIDLFEKSNPCSSTELDEILRKGGHKLVYSWVNITEISEPLLHSKAKTNVMKLLNTVEETPHTYIHSSRIPHLELSSAVNAFIHRKEYSSVNPFVQRFDFTIDLNAQPSTKNFLNYPLAEIIWDLHSQSALGGLDTYAKELKQLFKDDRALSPKPNLKDQFPILIERNLKLHRVSGHIDDIKSFGDWIYSNSQRCPAQRLGYEVWHKMIKNINDEPTPSDMEDFCHIECLPYVDFITLDNRMRGYVSQSCRAIGTDWDKKICKNLEEIIEKLTD